VSRLTRRGFLAAAALAAIGGGGALYRLQAGDEFDPELEQTEQVAELFDELAPARRIGRAYLEEHADEASERTLVRLLGNVWDDSPARLAAQARRAVRLDYESGRTVAVRGWILSVTEARLCALTTFG
jgi:hypothetical protein